MKTILTAVGSAAVLLSSVLIAPAQVRAESCQDIARQGEKAYNLFEQYEKRGDEMQMTYHYLNFQLQVAKFKEKGCR